MKRVILIFGFKVPMEYSRISTPQAFGTLSDIQGESWSGDTDWEDFSIWVILKVWRCDKNIKNEPTEKEQGYE